MKPLVKFERRVPALALAIAIAVGVHAGVNIGEACLSYGSSKVYTIDIPVSMGEQRL